MSMVRSAVSLAPSIYHRLLSPILPRACRFYPTCSVYMADAIRKHGILKGIACGLGRLGRCHPWHPGGYDPIK